MLSLFQIFLIASVAHSSCASTLRGASDVDDLELDLTLNEGFLRTENEFKSLNILTLGGSVTWGASIAPRHHAYPFLLQNYDGHKVTNLAIRATGALYPAQCILTMLKTTDYDFRIPFDVIIFDFSINGLGGFDLLLKRLRVRFPDALLIYVDLWSLKHGAIDSTEAQKLIKEYGGEVYHFGQFLYETPTTMDVNFAEGLQKGSDSFPSNENPQVKELFAEDEHHASVHGHKLIRYHIANIIEGHGSNFPSNPRLGPWLGGDFCMSWAKSNHSPAPIISGGQMREWDTSKGKWAIEAMPEGLILEYFHDGTEDIPINLHYMTKSEDPDDPLTSKYPPAMIKIEQSREIIEQRKQHISTADLNIALDSSGTGLRVIDDFDWARDGWVFLSGIQNRRGLRSFHVSETNTAGFLKPGQNFILIYPVGMRQYPFRALASIVCAACWALNWDQESQAFL